MLLTITQHQSKSGYWRYVLEQDGAQTHMLNDASLEWHMLNKLCLTVEQAQQVLNEICAHGSATLELTQVVEELAS